MSDGAYLSHRLRGELPGRTRYLREGNGEPIILVHGVGLDASIWRPQIDSLRSAYDVIAIDMLGHGGSSLPRSDVRLADYADQIIAVADGLDLGKVHVIGHSMGALVALEFALSHPSRSLSLVALNAVYCRTPQQRAVVEARAAAIGDANGSASPDEPIARWFGDPVPSAHVEHAGQVRRLLLSVDRIGYARSYRLFATSDMAHRDRLPRLTVPALFMTGAQDRNSISAMSRAMAAAVPGAQCAVIAEAGHMMTLTAADEVNHRLRSFLSSIGNTREAEQTTVREASGHARPSH
jgi:pimeloyl-ACP methyl ester carboxylesterase